MRAHTNVEPGVGQCDSARVVAAASSRDDVSDDAGRRVAETTKKGDVAGEGRAREGVRRHCKVHNHALALRFFPNQSLSLSTLSSTARRRRIDACHRRKERVRVLASPRVRERKSGGGSGRNRKKTKGG